MAQYGKVMMDFLTAPILLLQLSVGIIITEHPVNSTIYLYILLPSSVISDIEVSFISWNAAIIILIFWIVTIITIVDVNKDEIYDTLIAITFGLNLVYTLFCIIYSFISLSYL
jgi:Na+-transporting NADH:ubiquinone oxidoreductase subunit NqrE